jgi:hypothetical protein
MLAKLASSADIAHMPTHSRQANRWQRDERRAFYGHSPSYGSFLRAVRDKPGKRLQGLSAGSFLIALWLNIGLTEALIVGGSTLLAGATLGYIYWRWWVSRG